MPREFGDAMPDRASDSARGARQQQTIELRDVAGRRIGLLFHRFVSPEGCRR
jgi:hypothetical protein